MLDNSKKILPVSSTENIDGRVNFLDTPRGRRTMIKKMASCMIDAINGVGFRSARGPIDPIHEAADLPYVPEIPTVAWSTHELGDGVASDVLETGTVVGSLGDLYSASFPDQTQSQSFNTGFCAGVLAAQQGLIDIEKFGTD